MACAAFAKESLANYPRQIWELGAGIGKSRIAATLGLMLLCSGTYTSIYFVIPSKGLLARSQDEFRTYW
jgi:hypothetical protein